MAIRTLILAQNNGKRNLFSQNWSDNDAKKNTCRLHDFYQNNYLHVYNLPEFKKGADKLSDQIC